MVAAYTTRIRLTKQGTGDNDSTWGTVLNNEVIDLTDFAIAGYTTISLAAANVTLTSNDGASDESRSAMLELTGTLIGNRNVYIPAVSKSYIVRNNTSGAYSSTVQVAGGTGYAIPQGEAHLIYCDSVSVREVKGPTQTQFTSISTTNITGVNVSVTGNISAAVVSATNIRGSAVSATTITGGTVSATTINVGGTVSATNIKGSTIVSPLVSATNITGSNVSVTGYIKAASVSVSGNIRAAGEIASQSDERLKSNIKLISDPVDKVKNLKGVTFIFKADNRPSTGLLAQDVQSVIPEAVVHDGDYLYVSYGNLLGLIVEAIKELDQKITSKNCKCGK
jgi:hypothetical protein